MASGDGSVEFDRLLSDTRRSLEELRTRSAPPQNDQAAGELPVRGFGEACEGQVRAVASAGRLEKLELEPRLMRMAPEQLAPHVVAAANAALDDLRGRAPTTDEGPAVDPEALAERLGKVANEGLAQMASISQGLAEAMARISRQAHINGDPGDQGLEHLLAEARRAVSAASSDAAADVTERGEGADADRQILAVARLGERVETVEIGPRAMRAGSVELGERVVVAVNAALENLRDKVRGQVRAGDQADFAARAQAVQDLSLRHMRAYSQALAALMSSIERR